MVSAGGVVPAAGRDAGVHAVSGSMAAMTNVPRLPVTRVHRAELFVTRASVSVRIQR
jgi:hypothetical protein